MTDRKQKGGFYERNNERAAVSLPAWVDFIVLYHVSAMVCLFRADGYQTLPCDTYADRRLHSISGNFCGTLFFVVRVCGFGGRVFLL